MYKTDPEREIQLNAKGLINKWSRPIFELNNSYNEAPDFEPRRDQRDETQKSTVRLREESLVRRKEESPQGKGKKRILRAEAPAKTSIDFVIRPESVIESPKTKPKSYLESVFAKKKKTITNRGTSLGITKPKGRL